MANMNPRGFATRQRGAATLDQIVATILSLLLIAGTAALYNDYTDAQVDQATADWLNRWATGAGTGGGAQQWIRDNAAACAAGCTASHAQLAAGGYLPIGFPTTDGFGHTASLRVIVDGAGQLEGLVCASGGITPTPRRQNRIARDIGLAGGYVPASNNSIAKGPSWGPVNLSTYGYAAGGCSLVVALFVANSATSDDYLHRSATPGHPELNRMTTAIDMNGNALNNVSDVHTKAANQGMTFFGGGEAIWGLSDYSISFRTNYSERLRIYNDGHIGSNGYLTLPAGNGLAVGSSWLYGDTVNMALRTAANGGTVYIQGTAGGGGTANLSVAGQITANNANVVTTGNTGWYNASYGGGFYMSDPSWIRAYGDKNIYTGGQVQAGSLQSNSTTYSAGRITTGEFLLPNGQAWDNNWCDTNGLIAQRSDGSGIAMNCQNHAWVKMASAGSRQWYVVANYINSNYYGHNYTDHDMFVSAVSNGTSCGTQNNDFSAYAVVQGLQVASNIENNVSYYHQRSMAFMVPPGQDYQILWSRYICNTQTVVYEYR